MLGYTNRPAWWENKYGPAPYTSGNSLLWDDIRDGVQTTDNGIATVRNPLFARSKIYDYLPVDSQGQLRTPLELFVKTFNGSITNTSYTFGMEDPIEHTWRRSSDFAFSAQIAMAVLKPARYFAQFASTKSTTEDKLVPHPAPTYLFEVRPTDWTCEIVFPLTYEFIVVPTSAVWNIFIVPTYSFRVSPARWSWTFVDAFVVTPTSWTWEFVIIIPTTTTTSLPANTRIEPCDTMVSYSGGITFPSRFLIDFGDNTAGTVTFTYDALSIPDRFVVIHNGAIQVDTGYVGSDPGYLTDINDALKDKYPASTVTDGVTITH
jgi:hypothetical protein